MKKLAPRTARLAGAGAAAFVLALAAPAAAQAAEGDGPSCGTASGTGLGPNVFQVAEFCEPDSDGDTLTVVDVNITSGLGTASNTDTSVTVTGLPDFSGELRATAVVEDQDGEDAEWNIVITIADEVEIPQANNDSFSVKAGASKTGNVKGNDGSDAAPADDWDVVLDGKTKKGTLDLNSDGSFTYKANAGTTGSDTFTYHLSNGDDRSNIATVSITITAAGGGGGDDGDNGDDGDDNNNGGDNNGGNNGTDDKAEKDPLAKTGVSLPAVAATGAGALGAGAVALWFTRRRKESGAVL